MFAQGDTAGSPGRMFQGRFGGGVGPIDRRVFRKLRSKRTSREPSQSEVEWHTSSPSWWPASQNAPSTPQLQRDFSKDALFSEDDDLRACVHTTDIADMDAVGLDFCRDPRCPRQFRTPGVVGGAAGPRGCRPHSAPRRRQGKADPVSRGSQMRALWSRDRFLRCREHRKFDLRGCRSPASLQGARLDFEPAPRRGAHQQPERASAGSSRSSAFASRSVPAYWRSVGSHATAPRGGAESGASGC